MLRWDCKLATVTLENSVDVYLRKEKRSYHKIVYLFPEGYPAKNILAKVTGTVMVVSALFTIAKAEKRPKCLRTDEQRKKACHPYSVDSHSAQKHKGKGNQDPQKVRTFEQGQSVQGSFDFSQSQLHGLGPTF